MVGQHIGKYRVTEQIGRGGMGTVYRAMDETLHREVAIKVLNTELNDPTVARRFRAEAVTVARLNHPGIATIYELLQHDGQWLMIMEFLRGETLEALVTRSGPLPVERAADLVMQALAALAHAHSLGVVHRDLKPANLMLGDSGMMKVMDFGIARVAGGEQLTSAGFMMGTPAYMAPEQVMGQEIDARTDLYAMGLVLYHLVTAKLPFSGTTPFEQAQARIQDQPIPVTTAKPDLPAWVGQVLDIALTRETPGRFQTALLFREALRRGLAHLPVQTPGPAEVPPELVATAAPSSMPVLTPAVGLPQVKRIDVPIAAAPPTSPVPMSSASPAPALSPASGMTATAPAAVMPARADELPHRKPVATGSRVPMAAVAGLVLVLAVGAWFLFRPRPSAEAPATPAQAATAPAPEAVPAATPPATGGVAATPPSGAAPSPAPAAPAATPPAGGSLPATADGALAARGAVRGDARGATAAPGAPVDAPVTFTGARAFLVVGTKVEESDAALSFGGGRVTLSDPRGDRRFAQIAYADVTAVAHVRAKNPRWYPTLAAPPSNVDLPGGLFRSDRHWLAFQSRASYIIVRVNDEDYRRVIDTTNARLKVKVETLAAR